MTGSRTEPGAGHERVIYRRALKALDGTGVDLGVAVIQFTQATRHSSISPILPVRYGSRRMELEIQSPRLVTDGRGLVCEPITSAELSAQRNVHVVLTRPGGVRGNHYHEQATEIMAVLGPALVRVRDDHGIRDYPVAEGQAQRFTLPPRVAHAILNTGTETGVIVSFSSCPHDPARPDVVREILIEAALPGGG